MYSISRDIIDKFFRNCSANTLENLLKEYPDLIHCEIKRKTKLLHLVKKEIDYPQLINKINVLLKYGANVNAMDYYKNTPLLSVNIHNTDLIRILIDAGADVNYCNEKYKETILVKLGEFSEYKSTKLSIINNLKIVHYVLEKGANINHRNVSGKSILMNAVNNDNYHLVKYLLSIGDDVHQINNIYGCNLLFYCRSLRVAELLVKNGINVKHKDFDGKTVLMRLIDTFYFKEDKQKKFLVEFCIKHGANLNETDNEGRTIINYCHSDTASKFVSELIK